MNVKKEKIESKTKTGLYAWTNTTYVITYKYNGINDNATYLQKINNEIGSNYDVFFSYFKTWRMFLLV